MRFRYELRANDLVCQTLLLHSMQSWWERWSRLLLTLIGLTLYCAFAPGLQNFRDTGFVWLAIPLFSLMAFGIHQLQLHPGFLKSGFLQSHKAELGQIIEWELSDHGISITNRSGQYTCAWSELASWHETPDFLVALDKAKKIWALPKRALGNDVEAARAEIDSRISPGTR